MLDAACWRITDDRKLISSMAHGRKRSFLAGCLMGTVVLGAGICALGFWLAPPGYPLLHPGAAQSVQEWAMLTPYPAEAQGFSLTLNAGVLKPSFRVEFFGEPVAIEKWVKSCPGIAAPDCVKETMPNGTITYDYAADGDGIRAHLAHHPVRGTVSVLAWAK
jgi:hypothetical protein